MDDKTKKYPEGHFLGMWMGICMAIFSGFGIPLSIITENPGFIGIGPALGVGFGLAIGQSIENKYKEEGRIRLLTRSEQKRKKNAVFAGLIILTLGLLVFILLFFLWIFVALLLADKDDNKTDIFFYLKRIHKVGDWILEDEKINVRIILAAFWISHFLLWTFGDMVSLLQETTEPTSNELLLFVAAPLAVIQTFMIVFSLIGKQKFARWANICIAPVFMLFNIGYLAEGGQGWNYLLGIVYILFNVLIIWYAWKWTKPTK